MSSLVDIAFRKIIPTQYQDPLEIIWVQTAASLGIRVERDPHVFAAWDGRQVLKIGVPESLDPDDCLAQMILHEFCHALVEGPDAFQLPDWGLQIDNPAQRVREHACLRLQAALTTPFGLRTFFAATTSFRRYYDRLPPDPLCGDDPAVQPAIAGWQRAQQAPWCLPLRQALTATAGLAALVQSFAPADSLWKTVATAADDRPHSAGSAENDFGRQLSLEPGQPGR
ncbi:MAG: hypothetical protein RIK87_06295 [Fuerstiella sp.]